MTVNLYIGDTSVELAESAIQADPQAFLIDHSNYAEFVNNLPKSKVTTIYTSLGDLPKLFDGNNAFYDLLDLADNIYYCPPEVWSNDGIQELTEQILYDFKQQKNNVHNLNRTIDPDLYTKLVDVRQTSSQQVWISGCSMSHGAGVNKSQRYGQLIADSLAVPVSFLTNNGSSISWAVDQIVRSDIRANDLIVLGLTEEFRFPYWTTNGAVWHINAGYRKKSDLLPFTNLSSSIIDKLITDENCVYQSVIRIHQLVNFCRKLNAKLLIVGLLSSPQLAVQLENIPEFINYKNFKSPNCFVDLGTDNAHPGQQQHKLYADFCQSALKKLNYI
jgi:hypothetical protein